MLIEPESGEIFFINDVLHLMVKGALQNTAPTTIFELGRVHDIENEDELKKRLEGGGKQLNLDLASSTDGLPVTVSFSVQSAKFIQGEYKLLISGPLSAHQPEPEKLSKTDDLKNRIMRQTAKLASESSKRATAEEKAKREAESKIKLISGAVHHLNNPMNHILGAYQLVQREMNTLRHTVSDLLECDPPDPQAQELQKVLDSEFSSALNNLSAINDASARITDTVELLRIASGIDGWSYTPYSIERLCVTTMRRLSGPINEHLAVLRNQSGHLRFIGHPAIYSQAIDIINETLNCASLSYEGLSLELDGDYYRLNWETRTNLVLIENKRKITDPKVQELLRGAKKEVEYLLAPYGSRFTFDDERVSVGLLAKLTDGTGVVDKEIQSRTQDGLTAQPPVISPRQRAKSAC